VARIGLAAFGLALFVIILITFVFVGCILYLLGADNATLQVFPTIYLLSGFCFLAGVMAGILALQFYLEPKIDRIIAAIEHLYKIIVEYRAAAKRASVPETTIAMLISNSAPPDDPAYRIRILGQERYFCHDGSDTPAYTDDIERATLLPDSEAAIRVMLHCWLHHDREYRAVLEEVEAKQRVTGNPGHA